MKEVKLIILHRQGDYEKTTGHVTSEKLAKIIIPLFRDADVEGDWIILAGTKRFNHTK